MHIIPEFAEEGHTATLNMHGWSHTLSNPRTPYFDEGGKRDLRVAKRYAPATSTRQDASISESLKHEWYRLLRKKKKIPSTKIWNPVHRNIVLEVCTVVANARWHAVFQHLLQHMLDLQSIVGCTIFMHLETNFVKCTFAGAKPEIDVVCVWAMWLKVWHMEVGANGGGNCVQLAHHGFEERVEV